MVQTAEGALNEVHSMLQRIRELSVEAANSTLSSSDSQSVATEITSLRAEIDRIANATTFNGANLLTGALSVTQDTTANNSLKTTTVLTDGTGPTKATISAIDVSGAKASTTYTLSSTGSPALTLTDSSGNAQTITAIDTAATGIQTLNFSNLGVKITITTAGAAETAAHQVSDLTSGSNNKIVTGAGAAANFQVGANAADSMSVSFANARLNSTSTSASGYGTLDADITAFATATTTTGGSGIVAAAQALITSVDTAIGYVSKTRGDLGAVQNRLEHTTAAISVASENLNASESRIRDLDVASEMVNFTKTQILQQAGTAILAQANSAPQNILTLLR
jgi:flagellin